MSTVPFDRAPASPRALPALPADTLPVLGWVALCLFASAVWTDAFVWCAGLGLAAAVARPFVDGFRRGFDAFDVLPLFTLYYALSLLLRGMGLLSFVDSPYLRELGDARTGHYRALVGWAFFYSAVGMQALYAGYRSRIGTRWGEALVRRFPALTMPWRGRVLPIVVVVLMVIGFGAATARVHGPAGFLTAAANPMKTNTEAAVGYWWLIAATEFALVGFHVHMLGLLLRRDPRFLLHYFVLGIGLGVPLYLASSSKFVLLRIFLLPWLYRHFVVKPLPMWKVVASFAGFGALFPFFYAYRALGILRLDALKVYIDQVDNPLLLMFNRSYGTDSLMLIVHRTGVTLPFQWGHSLLDLFTFWIPRLLWPSKPLSFGLAFPAAYMPDMHWGNMTYASCSLPGELYLNFHVFGVVAGCALLGMAMRATYAAARRGPGALLVYGYAFITAMHLVEGCIASQLETAITHLVPTVIALAVLTRLPAVRRPS
ncbi:MAG: oligosaccharide repeat unit polymerase [Candidatus Eisenbacteria bacterium]|uniref:Oligosaccharide repeat unit polymerase n=1 Tax=Eiseniibacteriota bacterium TaxID=2212470 RepID=A0A933SHI6_UNCEI|nr:oligosaccharide repeat unit polymerase [Candidatus Eisenbacteria bacterium]